MSKIIQTVLREDFGRGVFGDPDGPGKHRSSIESDPDILDPVKLLGLLCRTGVYPAAPQPRTDAQPRGRG
jgi:hypothetical protein